MATQLITDISPVQQVDRAHFRPSGEKVLIFTAFAAFGQNDFKRLVAYSSVNHMGFVVMGVAVAAAAAGNRPKASTIVR